MTDAVRDSLHAYMATVIKNLGCVPVLINSVEDHIHLLFDLSRSICISQVVEDVKKSSNTDNFLSVMEWFMTRDMFGIEHITQIMDRPFRAR